MARKNCSVCSVECTMVCSKCKLATYCTKAHQLEHWPVHKFHCFPLKLTFVADRGREHYVARSDIKEGAITHVQRPLMIFPIITNSTELKFPENKGHPFDQSRAKVCIGCCQELSDNNKETCSECQWPVCNRRCATVGVQSNAL